MMSACWVHHDCLHYLCCASWHRYMYDVCMYAPIRTWFSRATVTFPFRMPPLLRGCSGACSVSIFCHRLVLSEHSVPTQGALDDQSRAPWVAHPSLFCASSLIIVPSSPSQLPMPVLGVRTEWHKPNLMGSKYCLSGKLSGTNVQICWP